MTLVNVNKRGFLSFYSKHSALKDFSTMLASGLRKEFFETSSRTTTAIIVGVHQFDLEPINNSDFKIGIQTEQYFDQQGNKLWGCPSPLFIIRQIIKYDRILDLSLANEKAYRFLPKCLRKKILFGPYVFPDAEKSFKEKINNKLAFLGDLSDRRKKLIQQIESKMDVSIKLIENIYGEELKRNLEDCVGLVNIHYSSGLYTEVPRFLLGYNEGLLYYSEPLAFPFQIEKHFLCFNSINKNIGGAEIYKSINSELSRNYKFSVALDEFLGPM